MKNGDLTTEEIVIVGSRYGDLADVVKPFYDKGTPIEPEDIRKTLGCDEVVLMPIPNNHDAYAVGVFTLEEKHIGNVWMYQAPSLRKWLNDNTRRYVNARIKRINTQYGLIMAETEMELSACNRDVSAYDSDWASNLPEVMRSINEQSLALGMVLLRDELEEDNPCTKTLLRRIDNLLRNLPSDLSAHHYRDSIELYKAIKNSPVAEVSSQCDLVLNALVSRGSKNQMDWWVNHWLPDFFQQAADSDLLGMFESDGYTLERVESLLLKAPNHLFHIYKVNHERFPYHLYYSALPQPLYNRLLTLLAVREAMIKKERGDDKWSRLPSELATEKALRYWEKLKDSNFVDDDFMLLPTTSRKQAMYIADLFSEKLKLKTKWKPFQDLWDIRKLAQEKWEIQQTGVLPTRSGEIDDVFE